MSHGGRARVHNTGALGTSQGEEEKRMEVLSGLRWGMRKVKEEAEDGGTLACNGLGTPGLSESPSKGVKVEAPGGWARGDPKWEEYEELGGPMMGGAVRNTWDMIGYPQEVGQENGRVLGKKGLGR